MGLMPAPEYCFITNLPTENVPSGRDAIEYLIRVIDRDVFLRFSPRFEQTSFTRNHIHIFHGLLLNHHFPNEFITSEGGKLIHEEDLRRIVVEYPFPSSPSEKIENLLLFLHSLQPYEGAEISYPSGIEDNDLSHKLYFRHYPEMVFYLFTLLDNGLIDGMDASTTSGRNLLGITLTYEGLTRVIAIEESGAHSKKCFIAMSFSPEANDTREAIKAAIMNTGFEPILIDEIHIDSDITINDALIAEIRKCRFMVCDFTQHKHGVYFEAGFALGLGRPVIYTCHNDDFANSHFDTNHYPHIIYRDLVELQQRLSYKIEAWILPDVT